MNILSRRVGSKTDEEKDERRKRKRKQENTRKSSSRKNKRLLRQVGQMTTLLTGGKVQYKGDGSTIITKQDLCSSPTLVARFHLAALKYMINKGIFDETCMESAKAMLTQLQQQKEATERRNKDRKLKLQQAKKQCTMDAYLNQKPSISSTTTSELITVRESKPLSSSSASSDSDFPLE